MTLLAVKSFLYSVSECEDTHISEWHTSHFTLSQYTH